MQKNSAPTLLKQSSLSASEARSFQAFTSLHSHRHALVRVGVPFRKSHREVYRQPINKDKENSADERFPRQCAMLISSSKQDCVLQHCVLLEWTKRQTSTQRRQYGMHSAQGCGMHSAQGCAMIFRRAKGGRQTESLHVKTKGWYLRAADISLVTRKLSKPLGKV